MGDSTFQPPIHLDPNQDSPQQLAFINQNFQNLASTLETNSFRIVSSLDLTIAAYSTSLLVTNTQIGNISTTVPHNLGYIPIALGFILSNSTYIPLPYTDPEAGGTGGGISTTVSYISVDSVNVYATRRTVGYGTYFNSASLTIPSSTIRVYLLQQTSS